MHEDAKKLFLIEEILKIKDEAVLAEVETVLTRNKLPEGCIDFKKFSGVWTEQEADEIKRIIDESCEQINPDDWK
jgi:hypothetical protein